MSVATILVMMLNVDREQAQVLREILEGTLAQLRIESARADSHDFREMLHRRERVVDAVLQQLSAPVARAG
jgi:hypothetical protein